MEKWLQHWLENVVAPPAITRDSYVAYEVAVRVHLIPGVGAHRLDKLEPEHVEKLYRKMSRAGAKPGRVHQVHRTIRAALNVAVRRKHIIENPVLLAKAPKLDEEEVEPCSVEEIKTLLETALQKRNSARWAIAWLRRFRPTPLVGEF